MPATNFVACATDFVACATNFVARATDFVACGMLITTPSPIHPKSINMPKIYCISKQLHTCVQ